MRWKYTFRANFTSDVLLLYMKFVVDGIDGSKFNWILQQHQCNGKNEYKNFFFLTYIPSRSDGVTNIQSNYSALQKYMDSCWAYKLNINFALDIITKFESLNLITKVNCSIFWGVCASLLASNNLIVECEIFMINKWKLYEIQMLDDIKCLAIAGVSIIWMKLVVRKVW